MGNSDGTVKPCIGAQDIYIPVLTLSKMDVIYLYQIDKDDYSFTNGMTITMS